LEDAPSKTVSGGPTPIGTWTLGKTAALNTVTVTVAGLPVASINVNGKAGPATAIAFIAGANQRGVAGGALTTTPVAQVRDQFANGVAGASVVFTVADGGGIVSTVALITDASGNAAASSWRLGKSATPQALRAASGTLTATLAAEILSDYDIDLRFYGPAMPPAAAAAFTAAAGRIKASVIGDLADLTLSQQANVGGCGATGIVLPIGTVIDDVIIYAAVAPIDGPKNVLAFAGPCFIRESNALTTIGVMQFDAADIDNLISVGNIQDVIQHEMLHVVGIGTLWTYKGLLAGAHTVDSRFTGALGINACIGMGGMQVCPNSVPVENTGGGGTADGHWRETTFGTELMTGFIQLVNPFSTMSIQSIGDLGYVVNPQAADAYSIPGFSAQQTRASILSDLSPQWESVSAPKMMISKTGRIIPVEKQ
ncbi:MAG TPA: leishmanolysin-related zinc metalloendopeptidase, partial [Gemmatimonadaceae bacterium]|nr:leishmanolysin-related zinc metalloendopeptidase [Gemmatimonadaceae bacterium]